MAGYAPMMDLPDPTQVLNQLDRVCASRGFARAHALQQLLRFIVKETLEGRSNQLSREAVFERFATRLLKVQDEESLSSYKRRLQQRLDHYYANPSSDDQIKISVCADSFVPTFGRLTTGRPVVGRETELRRFSQFYFPRRDEFCVVSIGGFSGIGKTTLARIMVHDLRGTSGIDYVASAHGPSDPRSSPPYLPFRDALLSLIQEIGKPAERLRDVMATSWRTPSTHGMASELGAFLQEITRKSRVAIFLDNFHLSDYATAAILSELVRSWSKAKVLVVVAFREDELRLRAHPYVEIERTLELEEKCLVFRPPALGIGSIREYLERRFPGNLFPPQLANIIAARTHGVPLYMANVVDHLQRFEILTNNDHWTLAHPPDVIAASLPITAELLIALPVLSVAEEDRPLLRAAALIGEEFDSDLLEDLLDSSPGLTQGTLDRLYRKHNFLALVSSGIKAGSRRTFVRYRLLHSSYREAFLRAFETLPDERIRLSNRAIELLTAAENIPSATSSAQIAALLELSERHQEAVLRYLESAGLSSAEFAHGTAALLARRGLALMKLQQEDDKKRSLRIQLNTLLGMAVMSTSGFAAPELEEIYSQILDDALDSDDTGAELIGLYGLWVYNIDSGNLKRSQEFADKVLAGATAIGDVTTRVEALYASGTSLIQLGHLEEAKERFELALIDADRVSLKGHWFYQLDAVVSIRCQLARVLWFMGQADEALLSVQTALDLAEHRSHPESRAYALVFLADVSHLRRDIKRALDWSALAISAAVDCGASQELAWAKMVHAWAVGMEGDQQRSFGEFEHSFAFYRQLNARVALTQFRCMAAEVYLSVGRVEKALDFVQAGFDQANQTGERYFDSELHRLKGEALMIHAGEQTCYDAGDNLREAFERAGAIGALSLQLRAALSIFDSSQRSGIESSVALRLLRECYMRLSGTNVSFEMEAARRVLGSSLPI